MERSGGADTDTGTHADANGDAVGASEDMMTAMTSLYFCDRKKNESARIVWYRIAALALHSWFQITDTDW